MQLPSLSLDELIASDLTQQPHSVVYQDHNTEESKHEWAGISEEEEDEYDLEEEKDEDIQDVSSQEEDDEGVWAGVRRKNRMKASD